MSKTESNALTENAFPKRVARASQCSGCRSALGNDFDFLSCAKPLKATLMHQDHSPTPSGVIGSAGRRGFLKGVASIGLGALAMNVVTPEAQEEPPLMARLTPLELQRL